MLTDSLNFFKSNIIDRSTAFLNQEQQLADYYALSPAGHDHGITPGWNVTAVHALYSFMFLKLNASTMFTSSSVISLADFIWNQDKGLIHPYAIDEHLLLFCAAHGFTDFRATPSFGSLPLSAMHVRASIWHMRPKTLRMQWAGSYIDMQMSRLAIS